MPASLRALWDEYKAKMAEEGKSVKSSGGGFGGTGFKFDENEAAYTIEKKKFQKTVFGLQDSDDEDVEQEIDDTIEQLLDPKRSVKTVTASEAAAAGLITGGNVAPGTQVIIDQIKPVGHSISFLTRILKHLANFKFISYFIAGWRCRRQVQFGR